MKLGIEEGIQREIFTYDSACSHDINFFERLADHEPAFIPRGILEADGFEFKALIPKFHLAGHKPECSDKSSLNYEPNVGRTSGELVETPWAAFNSLQYSVRERDGEIVKTQSQTTSVDGIGLKHVEWVSTCHDWRQDHQSSSSNLLG